MVMVMSSLLFYTWDFFQYLLSALTKFKLPLKAANTNTNTGFLKSWQDPAESFPFNYCRYPAEWNVWLAGRSWAISFRLPAYIKKPSRIWPGRERGVIFNGVLWSFACLCGRKKFSKQIHQKDCQMVSKIFDRRRFQEEKKIFKLVLCCQQLLLLARSEPSSCHKS